jgi:hypothetical protein
MIVMIGDVPTLRLVSVGFSETLLRRHNLSFKIVRPTILYTDTVLISKPSGIGR